MLFMNSWEIDAAVSQWRAHPVLGPASRTLANLRDAADANSDGWAYWPKPCRAAAKLQTLLQDADREWRVGADVSATPAAYRAALQPVKAFRTHSGLAFQIETV